MQAQMIDTVIIRHDPFANERGYSLVGREFKLKFKEPVRDEALTLDNAKVVDLYYVIDLVEYTKIVPESAKENFINDTIYIPTFAASKSFRPEYIKI